MDRYIRGEDVSESPVTVAWLNTVQAGTSLDNASKLIPDVCASRQILCTP